jgi:prophage regulatory protein
MQKSQTGPAELCPACGQPRAPNSIQVILDQLPQRGFVRQKLLNELIPFSPATLWRKVNSGDFPKPHKISDRVTGWRVEDVRQWFVEKGLANSCKN